MWASLRMGRTALFCPEDGREGRAMAEAENESANLVRGVGRSLWLHFAHIVALLRNFDFILNANEKLLKENV